ncbi:hypothetical protein [Leifsonia sp. 21MFCrub1.1]|uniref:hypothetical protein n=1 Tax=Leifsonia sp. 21MFCrub1.1 TaxID=1798223 RepID=UPI0008929E30|nr:hypothetical protein [Leifsonia sp. 21MFCrub1.1]SEA59898.1 hypothetical protein SAMN04515680_0869 [Leifsonia sp. 21MFCrub1.1]
MTPVPIHVIVDQPWWETWLPIIASFLATAAAVGIAVGSAIRDNHLRKRDAEAVAARDARVDEQRALLEAQKVVVDHQWTVNGSSWYVVNAGDGPIMEVRIYAGHGTSPDGAPMIWQIQHDYVTPAILGREAHSFYGMWFDIWAARSMEDPETTPGRMYPILTWIDGSGRRWIIDTPDRIAHLRRLPTRDEARAREAAE